MLFRLVPLELVETVLPHVLPVVVGGAVGLDGQCGFFFIEQEFYEHIGIVLVSTIEDGLEVGTHGEHVGAPPALLFEFLKVVSLKVEAVDTHETNQREEHRLMAKAQLGSRLFELDADNAGYRADDHH